MGTKTVVLAPLSFPDVVPLKKVTPTPASPRWGVRRLRPHVTQAYVQPDVEQQEHDAELGEHLDRAAVHSAV